MKISISICYKLCLARENYQDFFLLQNADLSKMAPPHPECIYLGGSKAFVCSLHNFSKSYFPDRKICKEKIQIDTIVTMEQKEMVDSFLGAQTSNTTISFTPHFFSSI